MPNPSNIDTSNLTATGFTTADDDDKRVVRLIRLTSDQIAAPTPQMLSNKTDLYVGPDQVRYYSNGSALATLGGGSGGSGGSDRTAVTTQADPVNGGSRVWNETLDGIPHTYGYDAQGRLMLDEWAAGGLSRAVEYASVPGFGIASGNRIVNGGQLYVPASQMAALKTALVALGAVVVPAQFWVPEYHCAFVWDQVDQRFRPASGGEVSLGVLLTKPSVASVLDATYSADVYSLTFPGWLRGKAGVLRVFTHWGFNTTNSTTKDVRVLINGTAWQLSTTSTGTAHSYQNDAIQFYDSDTAAFGFALGSGSVNTPSGASSNSPSAYTKPTYTANADLTITAQVRSNGAPGATATAVVERAELFYR